MLIITADDYGKTVHATDSILECWAGKRVTSASAMVFMEDSVRAAAMAAKTGMETGLHLNLTMPFSAVNVPAELLRHQGRVVSFLARSKFAQLIYNPFLAESFAVVFRAQLDEFRRLYGRAPDFYNGHHHMHLCANVLAGRLLPKGARVRGTFTFEPGEKDPLNRLYRRCLIGIVSSRYITTDRFYSIVPVRDRGRLGNILRHALKANVEIEVHPENAEEIEFLMGDEYRSMVSSVPMGNFQQIQTTQVTRS